MIKDSGSRRQFYDKEGNKLAVRDIQEGKGRFDLMPLDVVANLYKECSNERERAGIIIQSIYDFQESGEINHLAIALVYFNSFGDGWEDMFLEVSKHFEQGALKYGENNWQKGIPTHCYIDSAVRHYLKWLRGDTDEPHDRAFCWNLLCCIWTCKHKPELNDYGKVEE